MNQVNKKYIDYICILKKYVMMIVDEFYPIEIIKLIMMYVIDEQIMVSCGHEHGFLMCPFNNKIYVWGDNKFGQLGLGFGHKKICSQEFTWNSKSNLKEIICGKFHTIALTNSYDKIFVWGHNNNGQLGLGHYDNIDRPQELILKLSASEKIVSGSCGLHTIILVKSFLPNFLCKMYVCGSNTHGQLGLGHITSKNRLQELILYDSAGQHESPVLIKCGDSHTVVLVRSGKTYVWGANNHGQLGLGDNRSRYTPQELILPNVMAVGCGEAHTVFLTTVGKIYTCGNNRNGQLGLGHDISTNSLQQVELSDSISISCGYHYTLALTKFGEIYYWGHGQSYYTDVQKLTNSNSPQKLNTSNIVSMHCERNNIISVTTNGNIHIYSEYDTQHLYLKLKYFPISFSKRITLFK